MSQGNVWQRRYRDLEQQFEHLLLNVADSLETLEQQNPSKEDSPVIEKNSKPKILKVVKTTQRSMSYVYCVANGANMEYRFELFANKKTVQDSGYTRLNSTDINTENVEVVDTCRVSVKSDFNGRRHEMTSHIGITWEKNELG